jgi:hypothetical protein
MKIRHMEDPYPNFFHTSEHKLSTCLLGSGWFFSSDHLSADGFCVQVSPYLSFGNAIDDHQWEIQALKLGFRAGTSRRCRVAEEGFHL